MYKISEESDVPCLSAGLLIYNACNSVIASYWFDLQLVVIVSSSLLVQLGTKMDFSLGDCCDGFVISSLVTLS